MRARLIRALGRPVPIQTDDTNRETHYVLEKVLRGGAALLAVGRGTYCRCAGSVYQATSGGVPPPEPSPETHDPEEDDLSLRPAGRLLRGWTG